MALKPTRGNCCSASDAGGLHPATAGQMCQDRIVNSFSGFLCRPATRCRKGHGSLCKEHIKNLPDGVRIEIVQARRRHQSRGRQARRQELITATR